MSGLLVREEAATSSKPETLKEKTIVGRWVDVAGKKEKEVEFRKVDGEEIATKGDVNQLTASVFTMYKRKEKKVVPVDERNVVGDAPGGEKNWKEICLEKYHKKENEMVSEKFGERLNKRIASFPVGARLTDQRLKDMKIGSGLLPDERDMMTEILYLREGVLGWSFEDVGVIRPEVMPPLRLDVVEHKAWQEKGYRVPRALENEVTEMLKERMRSGVLERSQGPYRNPWFLVPKKNNKYRVIFSATKLNGVTRRDANPPPNAEDFAEDFGGCLISTVIDLLSGYDQLPLDSRDRDMTAISTPLGLLRSTRALQGATNSVAQFCRAMSIVLGDKIPSACRVFLDDIGVKGPKSADDGVFHPEFRGIRQHVYDHLREIDEVLFLLEVAGLTISGEKSNFASPGIKVVGWTCDQSGRRAGVGAVERIMTWPTPRSLKEIRSFLGAAAYFRILIEDFQILAAPLYDVLKGRRPTFIWKEPQQGAFERLKTALSSDPVVKPIDYQARPLQIIIAVDASESGWGAVLLQERNGTRYPARYESGSWTETERKYDAGKRECRATLKALKKLRSHVYGIPFILEVDAATLVDQLNRSATDVPGALVNRWLAWIRLFDFTVKHVPGRRHGAPDGLSRRPQSVADELEEDVDAAIESELSAVRARLSAASTEPEKRLLHHSYSRTSECIAQYLMTLQRPPRINGNEFKKQALRFIVDGEHLYRRSERGGPPQRVVDEPRERRRIMEGLHDACGHRGREGTYFLLKSRCWWPGQFSDVSRYVKSCVECQFRSSNRTEEPLRLVTVSGLFRRVSLDITYMPSSMGKQYLLVARCLFTHYPEARAIAKANAAAVSRFFMEEVIARHGVPESVQIDGGPENRGEFAETLKSLGIRAITISSYNSKANGSIEVGHKPLQNALSKVTGGSGKNWPKHLSSILLSDRVTAKTSTGYSPFYLLHGIEARLPVECEVATWSSVSWKDGCSTSELLLARMQQIESRDADMEEAECQLERLREINKENFDVRHVLRNDPLKPGELVLLHNTQKSSDKSSDRKLDYRWLGPYAIQEAISNTGPYIIRELDGTIRKGTVHGNRLKRFYVRDGAMVQSSHG